MIRTVRPITNVGGEIEGAWMAPTLGVPERSAACLARALNRSSGRFLLLEVPSGQG